MFFLGKAFEMRGKAHGDEEKPFLDHLEDLRIMITKIVLTLLITTVGCWVFHQELVDLIRVPVHKVWKERQQAKLPDSISIEDWEKIKTRQAAAQKLPDKDKESFFQAFDDPDLKFKAEAVNYYAVAMTIPNQAKRKLWVEGLSDSSEDQKQLIFQLIEKAPAASLNAKSKVVEMKSLAPTETFMLAFKLAFFSGLVISFPLNLMFVLQFVVPGLKQKERKIMWPAMAIGFGLFLTGVLFSYFFVLPRALDFFFSFSSGMGVQNEWTIGKYISFVTQFTLIFGLAFELPVLVMTLVKLGLIGYQAMSNTRSYAVLAIVVIAAGITPTGDMLTLGMLAVPMYILYEICIILSYFDYKKQLREEKAEYQRTGVRSEAKVSAAAGAIAMNTEDDFDDDDPEPDPNDDPHGNSQESGEEQEDYSDYHDPETFFTEDGAISEESEDGEDDSDSYEDNLQAQSNEQHDDDDTEQSDPYLEDSDGLEDFDEIDFNPGAGFEDTYEIDTTTEEDSESTDAQGNDEDHQDNRDDNSKDAKDSSQKDNTNEPKE